MGDLIVVMARRMWAARKLQYYEISMRGLHVHVAVRVKLGMGVWMARQDLWSSDDEGLVINS